MSCNPKSEGSTDKNSVKLGLWVIRMLLSFENVGKTYKGFIKRS